MTHPRSTEVNPSSWLRLLAMLALSVMAVSCDSASSIEDGVPRDVSVEGGPAAAFLEADGLSAAELLSASDLVMQAQEWIYVSRTIHERAGVEQDSLVLSPSSIWIRGHRGMIGTASAYANRSSGGLWLEPPLSNDPDRGITRAQDVRFIGETRENGEDAWVIWYWFKQFSIESPFIVWRTEWIAKDDLRLLRQVQDDGDPLGQRVRIESLVTYTED